MEKEFEYSSQDVQDFLDEPDLMDVTIKWLLKRHGTLTKKEISDRLFDLIFSIKYAFSIYSMLENSEIEYYRDSTGELNWSLTDKGKTTCRSVKP